MAANTSSPEGHPPGEEEETVVNDPQVTPGSNASKEGREERESPGASEERAEEEDPAQESSAPPLPDEEVPPPLPDEAPPGQAEDDGWDPVWDGNAQAFYFYNRFTGISQWENPRVPTATAVQPGPPGVDSTSTAAVGDGQPPTRPVAGGYDPAIHGDYDPTAPYAQQTQEEPSEGYPGASSSADPNMIYTATGTFNRFTGKWQSTNVAPDNFNDENKSRRQMNAFFDVDAAANSHDGKSLKAERSGKKLSKKELKAFKDKRRERKEEKRRAWLRD
ncbi:hypothetical protein FQN54_005347 [Arachnomyces sp. PD_36]|nr:hypothetical protein FQN54_005347 [Arachnomyces sp. PD_36]